MLGVVEIAEKIFTIAEKSDAQILRRRSLA